MNYLIFVFKLCLILAVVIWASYYPGDVSLEWEDYVVKMTLRVFLGGGLAIGLIILTLYSAYKNLFNSIKAHMERRAFSQFKAQQEQIVAGLIDVELGNISKAKKLVTSLMNKKDPTPLALLYAFNAAYHFNQAEKIDELIPQLQVVKELKILSTKYQIELAVSQGNYPLAFTICREALKNTSGAWLLKVATFLAIKEKKFEEALAYLKEGRQIHEFDKNYDDYMSSIIWYQHAKFLGEEHENYITYLHRSHDLNIGFTNAAVRLARAYEATNAAKKAKNVLTETWKMRPNSYEIAESYCALGTDPMDKAKLARELLSLQPDSRVARIILTVQYIQARLWGEAKKELDALESKHTDTAKETVDYLQALIAHDEKEDTEKAYEILQNLLSEHLKQKWQCHYCGHRSISWQPFCDSCDAFDHLERGDQKRALSTIPTFPS